MLEHHEQAALAEIEAELHAEDPVLSSALDVGVTPRPNHPVTKVAAGVILAVLVTTISTFALGPDLGALIAVLSLSAAFLYGWQTLRVCRGLRNPPRR